MLDYEAQLLYEYLAHRHQLLLPEYKSFTLEYLKKVEKGEKKVLKLSEAKDFCLPSVYFAPTKTSDLYKHCLSKPSLKDYVYENKIPNRAYLIKIIATLELETLIELNKLIVLKKYNILQNNYANEFKNEKIEEKDENSDNQVKVDVKLEENKEKHDINEEELENILDIMEDLENNESL